MFQGINNIVEKRKGSFIKADGKNDKLNRAFSRFLDEYFPEGKNFEYQASYNATNNKITIITPNKTIANELILKINNLSRFLREENITARHIIIH